MTSALTARWCRSGSSVLGLGITPPLAYARIGQGRSNLTFEVVDAQSRRWILRRPPLGHLLASAHDVRREHHVLSRLSGSGVPAPMALALCDDPAAADVPLLLMEHVDGVVVDVPEAARLNAATRHALGMALPAALTRVHAVDLNSVGLSDFASHGPYAARQLKRWQRQWSESSTRDLPVVPHAGDAPRACRPRAA